MQENSSKQFSENKGCCGFKTYNQFIAINSVDLSVVGIMGEVIHFESFLTTNSIIQLDFSNIPFGLYFAEINDGDLLLTEKIIIQKE
jgi:hypothetical protein